MSHDEVLAAVAAGRMAPLEAVLGAVRSTSVPALQTSLTDEPPRAERQLIDVRALSKDGVHLYEIWSSEADGAVVQLYYHARTAALLAWAGPDSANALSEDVLLDRLFTRLLSEAGGQ